MQQRSGALQSSHTHACCAIDCHTSTAWQPAAVLNIERTAFGLSYTRCRIGAFFASLPEGLAALYLVKAKGSSDC